MKDVKKLLAAHASGGLDPSEAARVETYLEAHPEARAEHAALVLAIGEARAAAEPDGPEPDWDAMAADIARACAAAPVRRPWWRPARPAWLAAGAVAAAGLTAALWLRREAVPSAAERPAPRAEAADDTTPPQEAADDGFGAFGAEDDHLSPDELVDQLDDEDLAAIDRYIAQKGSP